jgi:hypothetical protein
MSSASESPLAVVAKHQTAAPVNLALIASELGLRVVHVPLDPSIAGEIERNPTDGGPSGFIIRVNSNDKKNRQRFTLAHEIAHFILHRDLIESKLVDNTEYRSALDKRYETQANQLAADILMPIRLVRENMAQASDPKELARLFGVPKKAMEIRLKGVATR